MPHNTNLAYEFGPYQFDVNTRVLTRAGETITLTPKASEILLTLLVNAGQVVERDQLLREIWPDTFVEEANLSQNVFVLRRALGDERVEPRYIETIVRRGYRFIATVKVVEVEEVEQLALASIAQRPVVAVLPFLNDTGNGELDYVTDGITESLINNLSRVSKLRVMSRSTVLGYKSREVNPQETGKILRAHAVLVGRIVVRATSIAIDVELVDTSTGWQLWGETFDSERKNLLQIQDAITRQILSTLKLRLTGEEESRISARYTGNAEAYQCYLEGRHHWSRYTRKGIERAIRHFRQAIELDPNYALAYSGIIDCYLRLATNYLPPEDDVPVSIVSAGEPDPRIRLRFEWDWKGAERELRRANELHTNYPSAHQWYAVYGFSKSILSQSKKSKSVSNRLILGQNPPSQLFSSSLSPNEEVQVYCAITREQIEIGNYNAGALMLGKWWTPGEWPNLQELNSYGAADLLFTIGSLAGCLSSTGHLRNGQKHAEELLSGSIGIFEHLGAKRRSAEARIELALSYYRQGRFGVSRITLSKVLDDLQPQDSELRSLALIRLGVVERHSGHVSDSLERLSEAHAFLDAGGPLVTARYYHELGTTLEQIALAENRFDLLNTVRRHLQRAFYEFVAIGHHRYAAVVENNHGFLLLKLGHFDDAETHLLLARRFFEGLNDIVRTAQANDTLARLYLATGRLKLSDDASQRAVASLEANDEEALLAEALTTRGLLFCKLERRSEARVMLEGARRIAERCGDSEGASQALLVLVEEMYDYLNDAERSYLAVRIRELLEETQSTSTISRLNKCLKIIANSLH